MALLGAHSQGLFPALLFVMGKKVAKGICPNIEKGNFCSLEEIYWLTEVFPTKL